MTAALKVDLGRRYRFAASHRLHSAQLSDQENFRVYGKCNNPFGHGHNYVVEVLVSGNVDPATGMIANLADLDAFVEQHVIEPFDHRSLNHDVPAFREIVPTTENVCKEIYQSPEAVSAGHISNASVSKRPATTPSSTPGNRPRLRSYKEGNKEP